MLLGDFRQMLQTAGSYLEIRPLRQPRFNTCIMLVIAGSNLASRTPGKRH